MQSFDEDTVPAFSQAIDKDKLPMAPTEDGYTLMKRSLATKVTELNKELMSIQRVVARYERHTPVSSFLSCFFFPLQILRSSSFSPFSSFLPPFLRSPSKLALTRPVRPSTRSSSTAQSWRATQKLRKDN